MESRVVETCSNKSTASDDCQTAMLAVLGDCADLTPTGAHIIERLIDSQCISVSSKLLTSGLTACCRLFLRCPAQYQHILGHVLQLCMSSCDADVHDKAAVYYLLLSTDVQLATTVILADITAPTDTPCS